MFFEAVRLQEQLTRQLLQLTVLPSELIYLLPGGVTYTVPGQSLFPSFREPFGPGIVGAGLDPLPSAQIINGSLPSEPLQDDADLLFRGVLSPCRCTDLSQEAPCLLCALLSLSGLILYLGHHDSFHLGLIYPSEGASNTPSLFGFLGLNTVQLR